MHPFTPSLVLTPVSRWPTTLPSATVEAVMAQATSSREACSADAPNDARTRRASIVIVTLDNLVFNKLCLESVLANTCYRDYEILVVDNGSRDGTTAYLRKLARRHAHLRVVFNGRNLGFAAANNHALVMADGELLVLLNNDTIVPPGWLTGLAAHLADNAVGIVGPVTNRSGNEAQIEAPYRTYGQFVEFADSQSRNHAGRIFEIRVATMFCAAMRRDVWRQIGALDERFELGLFEDDDYSMRVRAAGYRVVCAEDVFVHHFGQASFGKLADENHYGTLFHANRKRWEEKWGMSWQPYARRPSAGYRELVEKIGDTVRHRLPLAAKIIVVSNGDDELLKLDGRPACHFPQGADGLYAGFHPADSAEAVEQLELSRALGGQYLIVPATSRWWLDHYTGFRRHLEAHYRVAVAQDAVCTIFEIQSRRE